MYQRDARIGRERKVIDFDDIDHWEPLLAEKLIPLIPTSIVNMVAVAAPNELHHARQMLLDPSCRTAVIDATVEWVNSVTITGYHGTRLTEAEVDSVRKQGLLPMQANQRRARIERALSRHELWPEVAGRLDDKLRAFGPGEKAGRREGQVHLTLSRSGLVCEFNEYLTHGSEIDRRIAYALLGHEGEALLANDGKARLIKVSVPGEKALAASNPFWSVEECLASDRIPNMVGELLDSFSYRLAHPSFQCSSLRLDCGMTFQLTVPSDWITGIESF